MYNLNNKLLLALILGLFALPCFAEKADREKPMHLEADQVVMDDVQQISTFTGGVQLIQGTMLIRGDKIVITQDKAGNKHATTTGHPASFRQKREGVDEYVESYAQRIEYDTYAETIDFYGQAQLKRAQDDLRGEHITYNTKTEIFQVNSGANAASPNKRIRAVFQPKKDTEKRPTPSVLPIQPSSVLTPVE
ncbi:MAG: lipopolysaccharide transport periplasmic protein LptA [Gallionella sp.]|nr:lipopolysaccharide transport periplasmic protein LptA [Gallionella sp.]MDD4959966.1 lipopolysaccharide transport periplasmic protein LptA [Gallionella sp.]